MSQPVGSQWGPKALLVCASAWLGASALVLGLSDLVIKCIDPDAWLVQVYRKNPEVDPWGRYWEVAPVPRVVARSAGAGAGRQAPATFRMRPDGVCIW